MNHHLENIKTHLRFPSEKMFNRIIDIFQEMIDDGVPEKEFLLLLSYTKQQMSSWTFEQAHLQNRRILNLFDTSLPVLHLTQSLIFRDLEVSGINLRSFQSLKQLYLASVTTRDLKLNPQIESLTLARVKDLQTLDLSQTNIKSLTFLQNASIPLYSPPPTLTTLSFKDCTLLSPHHNMLHAEELYIEGCTCTSLDLSESPNLKNLSLRGNTNLRLVILPPYNIPRHHFFNNPHVQFSPHNP